MTPPLLHPHWESTDSLPAHPTRIPVTPTFCSRRPAALVGIGLTVLLGTALFFRELSLIQGQLTDPPVTIRITPTGLVPSAVTLPPGGTIEWVNEQEKPHILSSESLLTPDGPLYTTAIFPGERQRVAILGTHTPGDFPYVSLTDAGLSGTVTIALSPPPPPTVPSSPLPPPIPAEPSPPPQNPFALSPRESPPSPLAAQLPDHAFSPSPKPFRQPQTGFPLWIASGLSMSTLLLLSRRALSTHFRGR